MAFATIRGVRILSLFKCPFHYPASKNLIMPHQRLLGASNSYREASGQCAAAAEPACGSYFKSSPCDISKKTKKENLPQPAPVPVEEPEIKANRGVNCCGNPCPDALPRFDKLFYRRSDKSQRSYQQTWDECPETFIKPKVICCRDVIKPKFKKRSPKERPQTACGQDICVQSNTKCPHINMPDCKGCRKLPTCLRTTKPSNCQKRKPPYPAFSECKRCKSKAMTECGCLAIPSICEVWAYYHKQHKIKKPVQS